MLKHIPSLHRLTRQLQRVPYLASKNLYRVAAHFLSSEKKQVEQLCQAILDAKNNIRPCKICFNWTESNDLCNICASDRRDKSSICVVESWHDLLAIEKADEYMGLYHVLGGALSPLEGIGPDDLTIDKFIKRIETERCEEVIFATNPTPEGEATASFIASKLRQDLRISRLASGVPIGSSLEYMDRVTIHKALLGRQPF
jgi:recombination protein RecR